MVNGPTGTKRRRPDSAGEADVLATDGADRRASIRPVAEVPSFDPSTDPIIALLTQSHRSDVIRVERCTFAEKDCVKAATFLGSTEAELRDRRLRMVRLQANLAMPGLRHFLPMLRVSTQSLRHLDLSRNKLHAADVHPICDATGLTTADGTCCLEVLNLSYNPRLGDDGLINLLRAIVPNRSLRAVLVEFCSITECGALHAASFLRSRPRPTAARVRLPQQDLSVPGNSGLLSKTEATPVDAWDGREDEVGTDGQPSSCRGRFFLNLNRNRISSLGLRGLQGAMPDHVSVTVIKQALPPRAVEPPPLLE